ncbi:MAG: hypothetical protein ACLQDY_23695 [Streptosporangiaceae bacterium]
MAGHRREGADGLAGDRQVPARFRKKIMVRVDGAGASHELIRHLLSMSSPRRILLFSNHTQRALTN